MRFIFVVLSLSLLTGLTHANPACDAKAAEKKLAGAAKNSFMKKCVRDSVGASACAAKAADKKLAGAAKNSFMKKCERDAGATTAAPTTASAVAPSMAASK